MTEPPDAGGEAPCFAHLLDDTDPTPTHPVGAAGPDEVTAISSLGEPSRRSLYEYLARHGGWVGRDEASKAVGLGRTTAAHHLDRLVADGLVETRYQRLTARQGPGAGRPAKLYRRAHHDLAVTLPPREYELAGHLLAAAAERARRDRTDITVAIADTATTEGRCLGQQILGRIHPGADPATKRTATLEALGRLGYEPLTQADGTIVLRNCPFHALARHHTQLICGMNLALLEAAIGELDDVALHPALQPEDPNCCVKLHLSQ